MDQRDHEMMNRVEPVIHDVETCDCYLCQSARAKGESQRLKERIGELEKALETLMDDYQYNVCFDHHYAAARKVLKRGEK
jgi:hypothetical protein